MNRAQKICEDVRRLSGNTTYRCLSPTCGHLENSVDLRPGDAMKGLGSACSRCGGLTEAVWSGASLPGSVIQPPSHKVSR